jgi:hypothetical protein
MEFEKLYIDYKNKYHQLKKIQKGGMNPGRPVDSIRDSYKPVVLQRRTRGEEQRLQLERQLQEQEAACAMQQLELEHQQRRELLLATHTREQRQLELTHVQQTLALERQLGLYQDRFAPGQGGPFNLGDNRLRINFGEFETGTGYQG